MGLGSMITGAALNASDKKQEMERMLKGRTPDQQKVIKYFYQSGGCMSKPISDEEYESILMAQLKTIDFKAKALSKIGLDESEVSEVVPVHFENFLFDDKKALVLRGKDGLWRSSAYQVSWIFFSSTQMYFYQYTLHTVEDSKKELTEEFFYKDITNFSTVSKSEDKDVAGKTSCSGKTDYVRTSVEFNSFQLSVGGDKFFCSIKQNDYTEKAIQGMKAKLREKKV
jgi:hypothetical protein